MAQGNKNCQSGKWLLASGYIVYHWKTGMYPVIKTISMWKCTWWTNTTTMKSLRHAKFQNFNGSRTGLQLSLRNIFKPSVNSLRPRQNGRHFADNVFKCNFLNENVWIPIKISLKFVPKGPINNILALVQKMAWRWTGDKPLSEPMMAQFNDAYMHHSASMS